MRGSISRHANGRWRARYRDPSGKQHARHFERKKDAQRWLDTVTADLLTGRYVDPAAGRTTVQDHAERWLAAQTFDPLTRETLESRIRVHITPHLGDLELRQLRPSTIQAWVRGRQGEVAPSYCRLLLTNLSTILDAAVDDGLLATNPCSSGSVRPPKVVRGKVDPWTVDRVRDVVAAHPPEFRAAPLVGACCGMRQGEVLGLALGAVDFLRRVVHVRLQVRLVGGQLVFAPPKGGREREVPLPDVVSVALAEHVRRHCPVEVTLPWLEPGGEDTTAELLFVNRDGGALSRAYYAHNAWKPAMLGAEVPGGRENGFHALRHHFASVLLQEGVSIRAVAAYLGHHDPGFTLRTYAHLMPDDEDRTRVAIDAVHGVQRSPMAPNGTGRP